MKQTGPSRLDSADTRPLQVQINCEKVDSILPGTLTLYGFQGRCDLAQQAFKKRQTVGPAVLFVDGPLWMRHHAQDIACLIDDTGDIAR